MSYESQFLGQEGCVLVSSEFIYTHFYAFLYDYFKFAVNNESYAERISLIRTAFETFVLIGRIFGPSLKEDVRAVAVSLYAGMSVSLHSPSYD